MDAKICYTVFEEGEMDLTSQQKVAHVLLSLAPKDASNVLKPLSEDELLFVGESILKFAKTTNEDNATNKDNENPDTEHDTQSLQRIPVSDFSELEVVKALYRITFGKKRAIALVEKLLRRTLEHRLSFLKNYSSKHLFQSLHKESNSVIGLVLGVLNPRTSAEIIRLFDSKKRKEIIKTIATQNHPHNIIIETIESILRSKLDELVQLDKKNTSPDGEQNLFLILEKLDSTGQDIILNNLEDEKMKERLEYKLFSWSSLELLSSKETEHILSEFDNKDLARLMLIDGVDASSVLPTIISAGRMRFIEEECDLLKDDFTSQPQELQLAIEIKRRFFSLIKNFTKEYKNA